MKKTKAANSGKKPAGRKRVKRSLNSPRAFAFVVILVALSIGLCSAIIFIHSNWDKLSDNTVITNTEPDASTGTEAPTPGGEVSVSNGQPAEQGSKALPPLETVKPVATFERSGQGQSTLNASVPLTSAENLGTLVIVIDDAGNNLRELDPFLNIPFPLTIAVLPGLPYSAEAARRARAAGKEVILHQPMEALGGQNPGPGAIYSGMSAQEIRAILSRNIAEVGPVVGVNNHQGSKITMDIAAMETVISFCDDRGIYFLDSRTTSETSAPAAARRLGVTIAERDVFIDNEQDKESMTRFIADGLAKARKNSSAVMIGHAWSPRLAPLLAELFPRFIEQGYNIKTVSDIIKNK